MSRDKKRSLARRMALLHRAAEHPITLNHECGMAHSNRDLRRLIREKKLIVRRYRWGGYPYPPKHLQPTYWPRGHLHGDTPRTRAVITPAGRAALAQQGG